MDEYKILYYVELLSIPINSRFTVQDIESNYKMLSKIYHPDMNKVENSHHKFLKLNEARDFLVDNYADVIETLSKHNNLKKAEKHSFESSKEVISSKTKSINFKEEVSNVYRQELVFLYFFNISLFLGQQVIAIPSTEDVFLGMLIAVIVHTALAIIIAIPMIFQIQKIKNSNQVELRNSSLYSFMQLRGFIIFGIILVTIGTVSIISDFVGDPNYYTGEGVFTALIGIYYIFGRVKKN